MRLRDNADVVSLIITANQILSINYMDTSITGFESIELINLPLNESPRLKFKMQFTVENERYLNKLKKTRSAIFAWGKINYYFPFIEIEVTGKLAIKFVVNEFLKNHLLYIREDEQGMIECSLNQFLESLEARSQFKCKPLPHIWKDFSEFEKISTKKERKKSGSHVSYQVKKLNHPHSLWYFKEDKAAQAETYSAILYQLVMGIDRVPIVKTVYENNTKKGVVAKAIKNYVEGENYKKIIPHPLSPHILIQAGAAEMLVASYIFEEYDLNNSNWGFQIDNSADFNNKIKIVRIDFGLSIYSLTSKYLNLGPHDKELGVEPLKVFIINKKDLLTLPILSVAKPYNWPNMMDALAYDLLFQRKKWQTFLKAMLLPNTIFYNAANLAFSSNNKKTTFPLHLANRMSLLKEKLLSLKEFQAFLFDHQDVLEEILTQFKKYNDAKKNISLHVPLELVRKHYQAIMLELNNIMLKSYHADKKEILQIIKLYRYGKKIAEVFIPHFSDFTPLSGFEMHYQLYRLKLHHLLNEACYHQYDPDRIFKIIKIIDQEKNNDNSAENIVYYTAIVKDILFIFKSAHKSLYLEEKFKELYKKTKEISPALYTKLFEWTATFSEMNNKNIKNNLSNK